MAVGDLPMRSMIVAVLCALMVATLSIGPASSQRPEELLKPYVATTKPVDPDAKPLTPLSNATVGPQPGSSSQSLLDGCVIEAIGRLPKVEGVRVIDSSYQFRNSSRHFEFWRVFITVEVAGRRGSYHWLCKIHGNSSAELITGR